MNVAQRASGRVEIAPGIVALPKGLLFVERSRALVAADAHLGYEDVIGGALPLWSAAASRTLLLDALHRTGARELIFLGDVVHGSRMSDGAARAIIAVLEDLRTRCTVTPIAGNHEGRSRGTAILGRTYDSVERDGWTLVHGDRPVASSRCIVGHLHPSLPLSGRESIPAFLASPRLIVVPALTPYSRGLNVLSAECTSALKHFIPSTAGVTVTASGDDKVYPFGLLSALRATLLPNSR